MAETKRAMDSEAVRQTVREGYAQITQTGGPRRSASCCGGSSPITADKLARHIGYSAEELAALPQGANLGLSCGNPNALAALQPGEVVLDLGSGGGFDVFIAGKKVGPSGRAIGVDMTAEMLAQARQHLETYRRTTGWDNVEFRLGEIEHLPVADGSVDVIISNCVINLSPDKPASLAGNVARAQAGRARGRVGPGAGQAAAASRRADGRGAGRLRRRGGAGVRKRAPGQSGRIG